MTAAQKPFLESTDSDYTWRWVVKDKERRELPLIEEVAKLLTAIQLELPEKRRY